MNFRNCVIATVSITVYLPGPWPVKAAPQASSVKGAGLVIQSSAPQGKPSQTPKSAPSAQKARRKKAKGAPALLGSRAGRKPAKKTATVSTPVPTPPPPPVQGYARLLRGDGNLSTAQAVPLGQHQSPLTWQGQLKSEKGGVVEVRTVEGDARWLVFDDSQARLLAAPERRAVVLEQGEASLRVSLTEKGTGLIPTVPGYSRGALLLTSEVVLFVSQGGETIVRRLRPGRTELVVRSGAAQAHVPALGRTMHLRPGTLYAFEPGAGLFPTQGVEVGS